MKKIKKEHVDTGLIGVAGMYEVLSRLSRLGWTAAMTPGNTKDFDVIAYKQCRRKTLMRRIEVKTANKSRPTDSDFWGKSISWQMNKKHENAVPGVWYCFVNFGECFEEIYGEPLSKDSLPRTSVYLADAKQVARFVKESHPKWLKSPASNGAHKDTDLRRFVLGFRGGKYQVKSTLLAADCRERWDLLEKEEK